MYHFLIILVVLWIIAAQYYFKSSSDVIAQISILDINPDILRSQRVPYVIDELLPNTLGLISTIFKYSYVHSVKRKRIPKVLRTSAMFNVIHSDTDGAYIDLTRKMTTLRIKMNKGRVVVVPPRWSLSATDGTSLTELFDPVSAFVTFCGIF